MHNLTHILETSLPILLLVWLINILYLLSGYLLNWVKTYWLDLIMSKVPSIQFGTGYNTLHDWIVNNVKTNNRMVWANEIYPGQGVHFFKDEGTWFMLQVYENNLGECYTTIFTYKSTKWLDNWMKRKEEEERGKSKQMLKVNTYNGKSFNSAPKQPIRTADTLIFKDDIHVQILDRVLKFINGGESKYKKFGISRSLGFCLHGPPGTGKTTIPVFVASQTGRKLIVIKPEAVLSDSFISDLYPRAAESIFIFDDIDAIINKRPDGENSDPGADYQKALYQLLSLMDSPLTPDGLLFFMTTNYPDVLDPALVRPGRVDEKIYISPPAKEEVKRLFHVVFPDEDASKFMEAYGNRTCSPSSILAYLVKNEESLQGAIDNINDIEDAVFRPPEGYASKVTDINDGSSPTLSKGISFSIDELEDDEDYD